MPLRTKTIFLALDLVLNSAEICFHFEENFAGKLRSKFDVTSFEVRGYFVRSSRLLRTKFEAISYEIVHFVRTSAQLRTNFVSTSNELRLSFERTSAQLRTNFEPTSFEVREVRTSHGNIISAATLVTYVAHVQLVTYHFTYIHQFRIATYICFTQAVMNC